MIRLYFIIHYCIMLFIYVIYETMRTKTGKRRKHNNTRYVRDDENDRIACTYDDGSSFRGFPRTCHNTAI